jgi:tellurite resistance protein TerC
MQPIWLWVGFFTFIAFMLALDLGVFNRKAHTITFKEASIWTCLWVSLAFAFGAGVYFYMGKEMALQYITGYLIEEALSVDNLFVFLVIFSYFHVKQAYQHRVLFWGIIGAILMRGSLLALGAALVQRWQWLIPCMGLFLFYPAIKMLRHEDSPKELKEKWIVKLAQRCLRFTDDHHDHHFFVRVAKPNSGLVLHATPLFLVLILIQFVDLLFAVDSIPAVLAISDNTFILVTSNVMAILGLRSMYFLLANIMHKFIYLRYGLALILGFIGTKMIAENLAILLQSFGLTEIAHSIPHIHISVALSLLIVIGILLSSIAASLLFANKKERM